MTVVLYEKAGDVEPAVPVGRLLMAAMTFVAAVVIAAAWIGWSLLSRVSQ